jgi:lysophospholipase L1-like esterase
VLISTEVALRTAGWFLLRSRARAVEASLPADGYRMLFIGESTTYGLWVEPAQAYPAQVASLLEARHPGHNFVAFNRGVPSLTTTAMLRTLPEKLRLLSPNVVVILAGVNDFHTQYNGVRVLGEGWLARPLADLVSGLRLYRLFDVATQGKLGSAQGDWLDERGPAGVKLNQTEFVRDAGSGHHLLYPRQPSQEALVNQLTSKLEANLQRMVETCRDAGAQVVLLGYLRAPQENAIVESVAKRSASLYLPTWPGTEASPAPPELFTHDLFHPSVAGHRRMAERIVEGIDRLVASAR